MRWDPLLAAATSTELSRILNGARAKALLMDPGTRRVALFLRTHTLVLELHPLDGWVSVLPAADPPPESSPLSYRIRSVSSPLDESMLVIGLQPVRGRKESLELTFELIGNRWNSVLVGLPGRTIRRVLVEREGRGRVLRSGERYEPPQPTGRLGADRELDRVQWAELTQLESADDAGRRSLILRRIAWTSSLNVDALLGPDGWSEWRRVTDPAGWGGYVVEAGGGAQPYPVALGITSACEERPSLIDAFQEARDQAPGGAAPSSLLVSPGLLARAERRLDRARGRLAALERELEGLENEDRLRSIGDLILARLGDVPRGVEKATLVGFDEVPVEVELDPSLSPAENANRYYDQAARVERARGGLPRRIREAGAEVERWSDLVDRTGSGNVDPETLVRSLGPVRASAPSSRPSEMRPLPYHTFRSSGGIEIRVGRGAKRNDELTFHHSAPMDVWMHVAQSPGAHVVLRWQDEGRPPRKDLAEAACLAALHSPARHSGSVPVSWTRRKYVRKPRGAPPGTVSPDRTETVFVRPDPGLIERLRDEAG